MFNIITFINLFKKINKNKLSAAFTIVVIFFIALCFCKDDEFGGLLELTKRVDKINNPKKEDFKEEISTIYEILFNRFYFVIVTSTTVGFGDVIPKSKRVRVLTFIYLLSLFIISFS